MARANLILIHRGPDYRQDFLEIAQKIREIDNDIQVLPIGNLVRAEIPEKFWQYPTLTVALDNFVLPIKRGPVLMNRPIPKLVQQKVFVQNDIPTPPAKRFHFGINLDPAEFGEYVILKPLNLAQTSKGEGIKVMRRSRAEDLRPENAGQLEGIDLTNNPYIIQKLIYTGRVAYTHRVSTLLGEVLWSMRFESSELSPGLGISNEEIEAGDYTQKIHQRWKIESPEDVLALAKRVAAAFPRIPLLGIDIIREESSEKQYALEINGGGNTWHFSSNMWAKLRQLHPELIPDLKRQFSSFDVAAEALVRWTRKHAR